MSTASGISRLSFSAFGKRAGGVLSPSRAAWVDSTYDSRLSVSAVNGTGYDLMDHVISVDIPSTTTVDANSTRIFETFSTNDARIDLAFDWRYGTANTNPPNHFIETLPYYRSGSTLYIKVLGYWPSGQRRTFGVYWNAAGGISAPTFTHLGGIAQAWSIAVTAGTTGDHYIIVAGGATYDYTMTAGQTAAQIATGMRALVNGGAVATAGGSSATVTVTAVNANDVTFTVSTGTSTAPANCVTTAPTQFGLGRVGPDTVSYTPSTYAFSLPYNTGATILTTPAWARSTTASTQGVRLGQYRVNGDGTTYKAISSAPTTITRNGPVTATAGTVTFSTRSAAVDWSATYTCDYQHRFYLGRKSDDTNARSVLKYVDVARIVLTQTCQRAYTPSAVAAGATATSNFDFIGLCSTNNVFTSNVTEAVGNQIANFSAPISTGTITSFGASADLSGLSVTNTILGTHGNTNGWGVLVNSASYSGFGSQTPEFKWAATSNPFAVLQFRNVSSGTTVPVNAQVVIDFWVVSGYTNNATTVGDNLLPDEIVEILRSISSAPTISISGKSSYNSSALALTIARASDDAVTGLRYFRDNALTKTTVARAYTWSEHTKSGVITNPDDDDGSYGVAHALAGLVLRYLRTRDSSLVSLIEDHVQYFITIEAAAVSAYGSFWNGAMPYWYWPSSTTSSGYSSEGGIQEAVGSTGVDPLFGSALGTINYTQGQVRRKTSIDQLHIATIGLYHYLYLLRNESAFTANTTLRTNALALLSRMSTFETTWYGAASRVIGNAYAICNGGTLGVSGSNNNGISSTLRNTSAGTSLANPFWGDNFGTWNVSNTDGAQANASANISLDDWFRAMYAPDSVEAGVRRYIQGMAMDMLLMDCGRHDVLMGGSVTTSGTLGVYRPGWNLRPAVSGNTTEYESPRTSASNNGFSSDTHLLQINNTSALDHMSGRAAQRACVLALAALMDTTFNVPTEQNGVTTTRSVNVVTALNDQMRTLAIYGTEPITKAQRLAICGFLGRATTYDPQIVEAPFTGYWMLAVELWHLVALRVQGTNLLPTYYRWAGV